MTRWQGSDAPRGDDYDARWKVLADRGENVHGEADLIERLLADTGGRRILDAGCGTGRVAVELARRGFTVTGVDADPAMLAGARAKAPELTWRQADLAELPDDVGGDGFDLVAMAGNVMIFVTPGTERHVVENLSAALAPGGLLVAGFQLRPRRLTLEAYDECCAGAGLEFLERWATWDRTPFTGGDYAVSLHRAGPGRGQP